MNLVVVPSELDGERLDRVLSLVGGLSRATAKALIDAGGVLVDGVAVAAKTRVTEGDQLEYGDPAETVPLQPEPVEFGVAYEDDAVIVVEKPAGLVVHPGAGRSVGTLAAGLLYRYPELEGVGEADRWGIVHRLDRDTSGLLLVGRTEFAYRTLVKALARREVGRTYLALVVGDVLMPRGTIDAPIGSDPSDPRKRKVVIGGRAARTHYHVEERFGDATLLKVDLESGRTHQIRVHLASIGHPVVGDPWYGRPSRVRSPRVFLHAARLDFVHPSTGERITVSSPLPPDLSTALSEVGG